MGLSKISSTGLDVLGWREMEGKKDLGADVKTTLIQLLAEYWHVVFNGLDKCDKIEIEDHLLKMITECAGLPSRFLADKGYPQEKLGNGIDSFIDSSMDITNITKAISEYIGCSLALALFKCDWRDSATIAVLNLLKRSEEVAYIFRSEIELLLSSIERREEVLQNAAEALVSYLMEHWQKYIPPYARESYVPALEHSSEELDLFSFWEDDWTAIPIYPENINFLEYLFNANAAIMLKEIDLIRKPTLALISIEACIPSMSIEKFREAVSEAPVMNTSENSYEWNNSLILPGILRLLVEHCTSNAQTKQIQSRSSKTPSGRDAKEIAEAVTADIECVLLELVKRSDGILALAVLGSELAFQLISRYSRNKPEADILWQVTDILLNKVVHTCVEADYDFGMFNAVLDSLDDNRLTLAGSLSTALFLLEKKNSDSISDYFDKFSTILVDAADEDSIYIPNSVLANGKYSDTVGTLLFWHVTPQVWVSDSFDALSEKLWQGRFHQNPSSVLRSHIALLQIVRCCVNTLVSHGKSEEAMALWAFLVAVTRSIWILYHRFDIEELAENQLLRLLANWFQMLRSISADPINEFAETLRTLSADSTFLGKVILWLDLNGADTEFLENTLNAIGWSLSKILDSFEESLLLRPRLRDIYGEGITNVRRKLESRRKN